MKGVKDYKRIRFYLWVGVAFTVLNLFIDLIKFPETFLYRAVNEIWNDFYLLLVNYLFFEYIIPKLSRKRIIGSLLLIIVSFLSYSFGVYVWRQIGIGIHIYTPYITYSKIEHAIADQFGAGIFSLFFFGIIRHIYNYLTLKKSAQQLRIAKQEAELNYLRSQTNPHFLFNTLNNIYSLARDKSDQAPESILKLSKILRFMLYETSGAFIAIEQEIKIITDYITLEQLRYDETLRINFNHNIEDMKQAIPPLLLIPLVENAFKHGASETRNQPFVDIHISVSQRQLTFVVKNSKDSLYGDEQVKENIGLSNLRRQLQLLYTDFSLILENAGSLFTATLKINLASHV
jgi:sensor histidine kinase YesM